MNIVNANAPQLSKLTPMALKNRLVMASRFKTLLPAAPELADILDANSEDKRRWITVTVHRRTTRFTFGRAGVGDAEVSANFRRLESDDKAFASCHRWQGTDRARGTRHP